MPDTTTTRWWWVRHAPIAPPYDRGFAPIDAEAELGDGAPIACRRTRFGSRARRGARR
ncbi:MAG: hypothetical protein P8Z76_02290 [Alphaproteobacteria bacterium]